MPKPRHFLWELYLALASEGGRSEPAGREAIKNLLPKYADIVDTVIHAEGDITKLDPDILARHEERLAAERKNLPGRGINERIRANRNGGNAPISGGMNGLIRARSAERRATLAERRKQTRP